MMQVIDLGICGSSDIYPECVRKALRVSCLISLHKVPSKERRLYLVSLGREASTGEVEVELNRRGLRASGLESLLAAFIAGACDDYEYVIALGSRCEIRGKSYAPRIRTCGGKRDLRLWPVGAGWCSQSFFLAEKLG